MLLTLLPGLALALAPAAQTPQTKHFHQGSQTGARTGTAICPAGDWNGDGVDDYAVGIAGHDATQFVLGPYEDQGRVEIRDGVDGDLIRSFEDTVQTDVFGQVIPLHLGTAVAGPFDTNGNGLPEVAASLPGVNEIVLIERGPSIFQQVVVVARLQPTTITNAIGGSVGATYTEDGFGLALANLGDVNGDGFDDLGIGSPDSDDEVSIPNPFGPPIVVNHVDSGLVRVIDGDTLATLRSYGGTPLSRLGTALCGLADVTGDGRRDIAIGAPGADTVYVANPSPAFIVLFPVFQAIAPDPSDTQYAGFGSSVAELGDVNGGGTTDLLVGSPDSVTSGGAFPLLQGRVSAHALESLSGTFASTVLWNRTRIASDLGRAVTTVDLDGDGVREVVCIEDSNFTSVPTEVVALDGATGQVEATFLAPQAGADAAIANIGDTDADGGGDFAVGLPDLDFERGGAIVYGYYLGAPGGGGVQTIWTVDDDGPADFDSVALAAVVVNSGDVLLVAPGTYDAATVQRSLSILGDPSFTESVDVAGVHVNTTASVTINALSLGALRVENVVQRATVSNSDVEGPTVVISGCADLAIVNCSIQALSPEDVQATGPDGVVVTDSDVQFTTCTIHGAHAPLYTADGGNAVTVGAGARTWFAGCEVRGGDGSDGNAEFFLASGSGGAGIRVVDGGAVDVRGNSTHSVEGGDKGPVDLGGIVDGLGILADAGSDVWVAIDVPVDGWSGPVSFGVQRPWLNYGPSATLGLNAFALTYAGTNEVVVLMLSAGAQHLDDPLILEMPLLIDPLAFINYSVLVGEGPDNLVLRFWPVPDDPVLIGATVEIQAFQYNLATDAFYGSNGGRITIVP